MDDEFDFRIVGNVRELERLIRLQAGEGTPGYDVYFPDAPPRDFFLRRTERVEARVPCAAESGPY
jgi:hypothetical protein